tara:strand:- start:6270 stop:6521 length:252 start_codon:yes stop_codon:yes gene_type:complete
MNFEGSREEFEELEKLTADEAVEKLLDYPNVFQSRSEVKETSSAPCFYLQRIPAGGMATMDFVEQRIRVWESEDGNITRIGVG